MILIHEAVFVIGLIKEIEKGMILGKNIMGNIHAAVIPQREPSP